MARRALLVVAALLSAQQTLNAGLRIDLRPVQPGPFYQSNTTVDVNVFLVDTGNPQEAIQLRGVFLDFSDSHSSYTYPDPDGAGSLPANTFSWINPFFIGATFQFLPQTSWVYPLPTPNPLFQITVPDNGEVQVGSMKVNVGPLGGSKFLDAMNDDVADPNFGARVDFGFGGPNDPVTTWRAFDGQLTGGVVELTPVPEPSSLLLILAGAMSLIRRRTSTTKTR